MTHLPVIVGFGGACSAGRSSFHYAFRRLVIDRLGPEDRTETYLSLATMMGLLKFDRGSFRDLEGVECPPDKVSERFGTFILENTLLRKINPNLFDVDHVPVNKKMNIETGKDSEIRFTVLKKELPNRFPPNWELLEVENDSDKIEIRFQGSLEFYLPDEKESLVQTAGQLPTGFDPGELYPSHHHPRGLKMTVYGASDAIRSVGIDWDEIKNAVRPDQIGVYAGSGHGQMDDSGGGGLMKSPLLGKRTSSRYLPLSLVDMPSNFINAYVIGNIGHTGTQIAACATFLYNLELAIKEIQTGKRRVAIVGNSGAPILPELIEGYKAMGALADDARLMSLSGRDIVTPADRSRSCRPFGENCGFTLAESSQFVVLFDDELTLELGAQVLGSIGGIFIKADGFKKSISSPGFGNYITLSKAVACARAILGTKSVQERTFVSAHGSGTPLNRSTESHGLNEIAKAFHIEKWPVSAIKCYMGHPLTPAAGDQLMAALGTWKYGLIPGIFTLDQIADDVHTSNLLFSQKHFEVGANGIDAAFLNSKGFGGNNATGIVLSPQVTSRMLEKKHGKEKVKKHQTLNEKVVEKANLYDQEVIRGEFKPFYRDSEKVLSEDDLLLTDKYLKIPGFAKEVDLDLPNPFADMDLSGD